MKKEIIVSVLLFALVIAGSIVYFTKYSDGTANTNLSNAIPAESILVFELSPCRTSDSIQNQLLSKFLDDTLFNGLTEEFQYLTRKDSNYDCNWFQSGFAALARVSHKETGWLFAFDELDLEKVSANFGGELSTEDGLKELQINAKKYFYELVGDVVILSQHQVILDGSKESLIAGSQSFLAQRWNQGNGNVLVNYELSTWLLPNLLEETSDDINDIIAPFKGVGLYEISMTADELNLYGSLKSSQANSAFNGELYGKPEALTSLEILPENTSFFWSEVAFDFEAQIRRSSLNEKFKSNLDSFQKQNGVDIIKDFCSSIYNEYAVGALNAYNHKLDNSFFVAIKVKDEQSLTLALKQLDSSQSKGNTVDSFQVGKVNSGKLLEYLIGGAVPKFKNPNYAFIGGFIVFSDNISHLNKIRFSVENGSSLANSLAFEQVADWTNNKCNLVFYVSPKRCYTLPRDILGETAKAYYQRKLRDLEGVDHVVYQMVKSEKDFFNHIYVKSSNQQIAADNNVLFTKELDAKIAAGPFLVTNYNTQEIEIMVVDESGKLHQINNSNETVWTYVLNGKVTSKPVEVDAFQNKKLQYLIGTDSDLYLIDRKGRDVGSFPIVYPIKASAPITVFESGTGYNVYVPCKQARIYGYNIKGSPLANWGPMNISSNGVGNMQYFSKSGVRYRFLSTNKGRIYLWNDDHREALSPIETGAKFTSNFTLMFGATLKDCKLLAIDSTGNYIIAKLDGTVSKRKLPKGLDAPKGFWWQFDGKGGKELVLWSNNQMAVLDQNLGEQLRIATTHSIVHVEVLNMPNGEEIFAVQTAQKELYLYTFSGELLSFEPFKADSKNAAIADLDKDGKIDLVVGLDNKLIVYKNIK
jgi:hypothetical protein